MAALTAWVRNISALVLLAGFLDMLLPNTSLRRFARLAVGLLVLLSVLKPAMAFLGAEPHVTGLSARAGLPDLGTIISAAQRLRTGQEQEALRTYAEAVAKRAEAVALTVPGVGSAKAEAEVSPVGTGVVTRLTVTVTPGGALVTPVRPVRIGGQPPPAAGDLAERVRTALVAAFELPAEDVQVSVDSPGG
ncbi:MAG: stage III sporulation protein AF [Bacillota bacterium]